MSLRWTVLLALCLPGPAPAWAGTGYQGAAPGPADAGQAQSATARATQAWTAEAGQGSAAAAAEAGEPVALSGTVTLKPRPKAHGPNLYLADVIAENLPPATAAVVVEPSGGPGTVLDVDPALVALKLRQAPGGPYTLKPGYVGLRVAVPAQKVSAKSLRDFATRWLDVQLSGTAGVDSRPQGQVFGLTLYDAQVSLRVRPPDDHPLRGYVELRVEVLQSSLSGEDKVVATVPVSFLVRRSEPRVFTTQAVNRGDALDPGNLTVQVVDTTFAPDGFADVASATGRVAKTYIPAGSLLDVAGVDLPLAIRQGDQVRLVVRSGAVEVDTSARALRDARVGETLPLQISDTGKLVQARCVDAGVAVQNAW